MSSLLARALLKTMRPERMRLLKELKETQWRSPAYLEELNRTKLSALLLHSCANVPYYRDFCAQAGIDPASVGADDLASFPLITKKEMIDDQARFIDPAAPASDRIRNSTGGSSGIPFDFFNDRKSIESRMASDLRSRVWTGWRLGDPQALLWGHRRDNKTTHSFRGRLLAKYAHRSLTLNTFNLTSSDVANFHAQLQSFSPRLLLGYSSALNFLATYLRDHELVIETLQGIISSAETLTPEYRENIENVFSCPLFNRYGSREFGVVAQQCEILEGMHIFTDQIHVEILNPEGRTCNPGELGEIVITDLTNRVMPFIRYRTGIPPDPKPEHAVAAGDFPSFKQLKAVRPKSLWGKTVCLFPAPVPVSMDLEFLESTRCSWYRIPLTN